MKSHVQISNPPPHLTTGKGKGPESRASAGLDPGMAAWSRAFVSPRLTRGTNNTETFDVSGRWDCSLNLQPNLAYPF